MITVYSDTSIHHQEIARYPDLKTLAKNFKPLGGRPQDYSYLERVGYKLKWVSWVTVLTEMRKNDKNNRNKAQ